MNHQMIEGILTHQPTQIFCDGTFKTCPKAFYQIFIISFKFEIEGREANIPGVYALMTHKSEYLYTEVYRYVKGLLGTWSPSTMMSDFEPAIMAAGQNLFRGIRVMGCRYD